MTPGPRLVQLHSPEVQELLAAAQPRYKVTHREGLTIYLDPESSTPWRALNWVIGFNRADLYYPHDWFWEASSNQGHVINRKLHGPQALQYLTEMLRKES